MSKAHSGMITNAFRDSNENRVLLMISVEKQAILYNVFGATHAQAMVCAQLRCKTIKHPP